MKNETSKIMVIDDHPIIHDGLKTLLATEDDLEIIAVASSVEEALLKLQEKLPDIVIVDLSLGDSDGTFLIEQVKKLYPKLLVLVYTMSEEKLFAERTAAVGANGYVMKTSPPASLKSAIRTILSGELYFTPESKRRILRKIQGHSNRPRSLIDTLSNREMDIFKLIGEGLDTVTISEHLKISRNTVDTHRINIKNKLELPNGKALDRLAYEVIKKGKFPKQ
ncbi:response regulator transcription factor [Pontiellaceae bacterium B1224]|nr:response regulator transcription factor [Pontiellaceae bacterium B1224]